MFQNKPGKGKRLIQFALAAAILLPACAAYAGDVDYTFSGTGSGTIAGNTNATFTDAAFSASFALDPASIVSFGPGSAYYLFADVSGTFTEGSYTTTLTGVTIEVNGNPNTDPPDAYETLYLFSTDFGSAIGFNSDPSLLNYAFTAPFTTGSVTGAEIGAYQDPDGFGTSTGDVVEFTGLDSLEFTAAAPEPPPAVLLLTGLLCLFGAGLLRRTVRA